MEYTVENLGKKDPEYGGTLTDVSTLPVGTTFYVQNGGWHGQVVEQNGVTGIAVLKSRTLSGVQERVPEGIMPFHDEPSDNILALSSIVYPNA